MNQYLPQHRFTTEEKEMLWGHARMFPVEDLLLPAGLTPAAAKFYRVVGEFAFAKGMGVPYEVDYDTAAEKKTEQAQFVIAGKTIMVKTVKEDDPKTFRILRKELENAPDFFALVALHEGVGYLVGYIDTETLKTDGKQEERRIGDDKISIVCYPVTKLQRCELFIKQFNK